MTNPAIRQYLIAALMGLGTGGVLGLAAMMPAAPAEALVVFDPSNYAQNLLTAARTLQSINNQIRSLQNEASMLTNMAKNLKRIDFPELQQINQTLQKIDRLMGQAQGIDFHVDELDAQFRRLFPAQFNQAMSTNDRVMQARNRLETAMTAFHQAMGVQSQIIENVATDARTLSSLVERSQNAEGALQAAQTSNQLLALTAKQQFQIQQLMSAQYRAEAMEAARRVQAESDARASTRKFLGSGSAYSPR